MVKRLALRFRVRVRRYPPMKWIDARRIARELLWLNAAELAYLVGEDQHGEAWQSLARAIRWQKVRRRLALEALITFDVPQGVTVRGYVQRHGRAGAPNEYGDMKPTTFAAYGQYTLMLYNQVGAS
jgi:hypothetical protein